MIPNNTFTASAEQHELAKKEKSSTSYLLKTMTPSTKSNENTTSPSKKKSLLKHPLFKFQELKNAPTDSPDNPNEEEGPDDSDDLKVEIHETNLDLHDGLTDPHESPNGDAPKSRKYSPTKFLLITQGFHWIHSGSITRRDDACNYPNAHGYN